MLKSDEEHADASNSGSGLSAAAVIGGVLGVMCLVLVLIVIVKKTRAKTKKRMELELLVAKI